MASPVILGIDEVGRGPWAGPLVVGAVILGEPQDFWEELADSKKLTAKKRNELSAQIIKHSAAHATGWVSAAELDQYGLSAALKLATRRAVKQILAKKVYFSEIIIDGTVNFLQNTPLAEHVSTLPKADALVKEVSAASIIAKVARDQYMADLETKYPGYGFAKHVGYGTAAHKAALLKLGPCPEHRKSFRPIAELLIPGTNNHTPTPAKLTPAKNTNLTETKSHKKNHTLAGKNRTPSTSERGQTAELAVAEYLANLGHQIIAHNHKTKTYEIDLISIKDQNIFFTEVKYSQKLDVEGTPLARITPEKQTQMRYAAETFITSHPQYNCLNPILAAASVTGCDYRVQDWFVLA